MPLDSQTGSIVRRATPADLPGIGRLGALWGTCIDIAGEHAGVVSACMNTAGQIGGVLSPVILALIVRNFSDWTAPLYLSGALYLAGALCWWFIDPRRPIVAVEPHEVAILQGQT